MAAGFDLTTLNFSVLRDRAVAKRGVLLRLSAALLRALPGHLGTQARAPVQGVASPEPRAFIRSWRLHDTAASARVNFDKSSSYRTNVEYRSIEGNKTAALPQVQRLTVDVESAGQRLDNFLIRILKGVPKTHVYRVIRSGEVRVNKGRAQADTRVATGDEIRVPPMRLPEPSTTVVPAREFPLLFEDEHLLAIHKPAGVAVHGGSGVSFGVIEQLRRARPDAAFLELVHRLIRKPRACCCWPKSAAR